MRSPRQWLSYLGKKLGLQESQRDSSGTARPKRKRPQARQIYPGVTELESRLAPASLIDLNTNYYNGSPANFVDLNGTLLFSAASPVTDITGQIVLDNELWRSDGTTAGTARLVDIHAGSQSSNITNMTKVGNIAYFVADDGISGPDLWRSDGTSAGTYRVKDLTSQPSWLTAAGSNLIFADSDSAGRELWVSDGTPNGTVRISDINPGSASSSPSGLFAVGNTVYFGAFETNNGSPMVLYKSDGTPGGTGRVLDAGGHAINFSSGFTAIGSTVYFTALDGNGLGIWKTDGTQAGTGLIRDINSSTSSFNITNLAAVGTKVVFRGNDGTGAKLWVTDGTAANTTVLNAVTPGALMTSGSIAYFRVSPGTGGGTDLWITDGTVGGTQMLATVGAQPLSGSTGITGPDGRFYFDVYGPDGRQLWRTDGTSGGTAQVKPGLFLVDPGSPGSLPQFGISNNKLYLAANGGTGMELWTTDSSIAGTTEVKEIAPGSPGSSPSNFVAMGGAYYFATTTNAFGQNGLWRTDGTAAGTTLIRNFDTTPYSLTVIGNVLYFAAASGNTGVELWRSDGTTAGTALFKDLRPGTADSNPQGLTNVNGTLYFQADDGTGEELWVSNGTVAGTQRVKDINTTAGAGSFPNQFTAFNGFVYFTANDGSTDIELWRTDGTGANTFRLTDIDAGAGISNFLNLVVFNGALYFTALDPTFGYSLYRSDTNTGAAAVTDIAPGNTPWAVKPVGVFGGYLYLQDWYTGDVWRTDGTAAGTVQLFSAPAGSTTGFYTPAGSTLYFFNYNNSNNPKLWRTDGTVANTSQVHSFAPYTSPLSAPVLTGDGGLAFRMNRYASNQLIQEVWKSNGTDTGTVLVDTVGNSVSGTGSSQAAPSLVNGRLVFQNNDGVNGAELWSVQVVTNSGPTAIIVSNVLVPEHQPVGTLVGTLSATGGTGVTFSLVAGTGSTNNSQFTISGNNLLTNAVFDYPTQSVYNIRVRATDANSISFDQAFTITVTPVNQPPVAHADQLVVSQNATTFTTADVLANDTDPNGDLLAIDSFTQGSHGTVVTATLSNGGPALAYRPATGFAATDTFQYTARDPGGLLSTATVTVTVTANTVIVEPTDPNLVTDLQAVVTAAAAAPTATTVALNVNGTNIAAAVDAIRQLTPPAQPVTITLDANAGTYHGIHMIIPANVKVVLDGQNGQVTLVGASPALTVDSGQVVVQNGVTLTNTTDASTILVTGGSLTVRNSVIQETTGGNRAAIEVQGGTVDLGTVASPGGNTFGTNGPGLFINNLSAASISALGNTFQVDGATVTDATVLAAKVFDHADDATKGVVFYSPAATTTTVSPSLTSPVYGQSLTFTATVSSGSTPSGMVQFQIDGQNFGSAVALVNGSATSGTTTPGAGPHSYTANYLGNVGFAATSDMHTLNISKATPIINWSTPADITAGTALDGTQLNASTNVGGTFAYTVTATSANASGAVLAAGPNQSLTATFTPTDTADYNTATATVSINVTSANPVTQLPYWQLNTLSPSQIPLVTVAQIASIPDNYWFVTLSADQRAALTLPQVQALDTSVINIGYLTPQQVAWLTPTQVQQLPYSEFMYLPASQITSLTTTQVAAIPSSYWFATMAADARAALTMIQVQALDTSAIYIGYLTPQQVAWLAPAQVQQLPFWQFMYLPASQVANLTSAQVAAIPNSYWFATIASDARAALTAPQVQVLDTSAVNIALLTPAQRNMLSAAQVQQLDFSQFQYLDTSPIVNLTPAQIAAIPSNYWFATISADARAALTQIQVQALNTSVIDIGYLTVAQRQWLTVAQIQQLSYWDFQYLTASQVASLTLTQLASIPDNYWFLTLSADARAALTADQLAAMTFPH
jgi:ELWxxDGT repeat protein